MDNNKNELSINEMDGASGGLCGIPVSACIDGDPAVMDKTAALAYDCVKDRKIQFPSCLPGRFGGSFFMPSGSPF